MSSYDQARMPLTMDNVQGWARENFLAVFSALPHINTLIFGDNDDDLTYDRKIGRNLDRSEHKKLLLVGRYSPGPDVEDAEILAHIHEGESEIAFFMSEQLDDGRFELHVVKNTSAIAFYPPLSDVGNDTENNKSIQRVEALISYYFLAAGHLKEIFRSKRFEKLFTRGFQDACYWIANGGEAPLRTPLDSLQLLDGGARSDTATMIGMKLSLIRAHGATWGANAIS